VGPRTVLRRRLLAAGTAVALSVTGFALAGETGAAPGDSTATEITLTDITSVTSVTTDVTTILPTTVLTATRAVKVKPPPRKHARKRKVSTSTSTAATTARPPATTQLPRTTPWAPRRGTTIAAAGAGSSSLPGWAIAGMVLGGVLIAAGLGGLYITRIRRT
jgi:hypothetical protein